MYAHIPHIEFQTLDWSFKRFVVHSFGMKLPNVREQKIISDEYLSALSVHVLLARQNIPGPKLKKAIKLYSQFKV